MRLRLGPPRWWSGWRVTARVGEAMIAGWVDLDPEVGCGQPCGGCERHPGRARRAGCAVFGSDLPQRVGADPAGAWSGGRFPDRAPRVPDPVPGDPGEDRAAVP